MQELLTQNNIALGIALCGDFESHRCMARLSKKAFVGWKLRDVLIARKQARTTDATLQKPRPTRQTHSNSCCARQGCGYANSYKFDKLKKLDKYLFWDVFLDVRSDRRKIIHRYAIFPFGFSHVDDVVSFII